MMEHNAATDVKERPILFSGEMVRAILSGKKTQTRRVVKPQPPSYIDALHGNRLRQRAPYMLEHYETGSVLGYGFYDSDDVIYKCQYGSPGDRLWVRETWAVGNIYDDKKPSDICKDIRRELPHDKAPCGVRYPASTDLSGLRLRPSIHMPRWASRITLEITGVRVERLQDISEEDAKAEGVNVNCPIGNIKAYEAGPYAYAFSRLWCDINGPESWTANPWVWVVEFERIKPEAAQ